MFVSCSLNPEHPLICDEAEQMFSLLSVACCVVTCKHHCIAIVSVYCFHAVSFTEVLLVLLS